MFSPESELVVREAEDERWELVRPLVYRGNRESFTVPAGFRTDFASVPRPFWWLVPRYGRFTKAAVLHDYLWQEGALSRCDADGIFRRAMHELGVPFLRRWLMWTAVRWGANRLRPVDCGARQLLLVLAITLTALPLLAGALLVALFLVLFMVLEWLAYGVLLLLPGRLGIQQPVRPTLRWNV